MGRMFWAARIPSEEAGPGWLRRKAPTTMKLKWNARYFRRILLGMMLALSAAAVALALGWSLIDEPMSQWRAWQIRFGGRATRHAALIEARASEGRAAFAGVWAAFAGEGGAKVEAEAARRGAIRARRLLPVVAVVAERDRDPACRAAAFATLAALASPDGSLADRVRVLRLALGGIRDPEPAVRAAALSNLAPLASLDRAPIGAALRAGLSDPDPGVRVAAVRGWAALGVLDPTSRDEASTLLARVASDSPEVPMRVAAVWSLSMVGRDPSRPGDSGIDILPSLVGALGDPVAPVRLAAATLLSRTTLDDQHQPASRWIGRRDELLAPLRAARSDPDQAVRIRIALALSWLGDRDTGLRAILEEAATTGPFPSRADCQSALATWPPADEASDPEATPPSTSAPDLGR